MNLEKNSILKKKWEARKKIKISLLSSKLFEIVTSEFMHPNHTKRQIVYLSACRSFTRIFCVLFKTLWKTEPY